MLSARKVAKPNPAVSPPYLAMTDSKTPEEAPSSKAAAPPPDAVTPEEGASAGAASDASTNGANDTTANGHDVAKAEAPAADDAAGTSAPAEASAEDDAPDSEASLFPRGNPLNIVRGGITTAVSGFLAYLLMAHDAQLRAGVPLGILCIAVATWGVMDLVGSFDDTHAEVGASTTLSALVAPLTKTAIGVAVFALTLAGAASGLLSTWQGLWGVLVTASFLALVLAVFDLGVKLGPWAKDELGLARPVWQRQGFWVIVAASVLLLPCMGSYSLWDPWETHYGEVAREILARDDWISLWWAQDGWFWSKPILDFWIQAIFMATLGVHYQPDQMLQGIGGAEAHPEWVVRTPVFLLTVMAMYLLYKGVAKVFGRRAGLIGGLILATLPDWWFLAHQTMTDMPFVAPTTSAMGLILIGLYTDADAKVKVYEVKTGSKTWRLSAWHLVFGAVLMCALPQIIYLLSRNVELVLNGSGPYGFRPHWDEFRSGSGMGNCGLPGNEACVTQTAATVPASVKGNITSVGMGLWRYVGAFEPSLQALTWMAVLGFLLYLNWGERRARRLCYLGGWFFCALATMGKGPAGFGLPILCGLAYVATTKRWGELVRFELVSGLCIILVVAIPWWVAMYVRHGSPFTDRLIFHDMVNRAFSHVHDTNEGDDTSFRFYIWQLGYALFPWTGLAPLGLIYSLRRSDVAGRIAQFLTLGAAGSALADRVKEPTKAEDNPVSAVGGQGEASIFLMMWFVFAFTLFSFMGTKFHHYIFPAVPPVAMLLGIALDGILGDGSILVGKPAKDGGGKAPGLIVYFALMTAGVGLLVAGVARAWPGSIFGEKTNIEVNVIGYVLSAAMTAAGVAILLVTMALYRTRTSDAPEAVTPGAPRPFRDLASAPRVDEVTARNAGHERLMIGAAAVSGAMLLAIVGRDLIIKPDNADQPGAIRLLQLFTYNYRRPWPDSLDFSAVLTGFALVGVALGLVLAVRKIQKHVVVALLAFGFVWAVWGRHPRTGGSTRCSRPTTPTAPARTSPSSPTR